MAAPAVVCAPNAFKGALTAAQAAAAMARGVVDAGGRPILVPVADGGDGTLDVLLASRPDQARVTRHRVTGPLGRPLLARLGWVGPGSAVVELAEASGLRRLPRGRLDPMRATSRGTGELIALALEAGARRVLVGVGGSACTDGGAGLLQGLGARLTDAAGHDLGRGGSALAALAHVELSGLSRLPGVGLTLEVALDVDNPLLGPAGAAATFAPQKGATPDQVRALEAALSHLVDVVDRELGDGVALAARAGAGAAGGCGFALAGLGARLLPGAALVCDMAGLDEALGTADAVLTGEGRLDAQTARGKAPAEVARRARAAGVPVAAIAGAVDAAPEAMFDSVLSLDSLAGSLDPRRHARSLLRRAARQAVNALSRPA